jgi:hypothetical protein
MSEGLGKLSKKCRQIGDLFASYTTMHWLFDVSNSRSLLANISRVEQENYGYWIPPNKLEWRDYVLMYCWYYSLIDP